MSKLFDTKEFLELRPWFLDLEMASIRTTSYQTGAITFVQQQTLQAREGMGPQIHNAELLAMVRRTDSKEAFERLAKAVGDLGDNYKPKYKQLMAILDLDKGVGPAFTSTNPAVSGADASPAGAQNSEEREANPWKHERFVESTASLIRKLTSTLKLRSLCLSFSLIDDDAHDKLCLIQLESKHNAQLISILKKQGSPDSFAKFREVIRHMDSTNVFTDMLREWDSIGPSPDQSEYLTLRKKLDR